MDAVKYLTELHRMCTKSNTCADCPIYKATKRNCGMAYSNAEMLAGHVEIVEQWAKEHPVETRKSRFLKEFPYASVQRDGTIDICPRYMDKTLECKAWGRAEMECIECEREFWGTEV